MFAAEIDGMVEPVETGLETPPASDQYLSVVAPEDFLDLFV